jgi:hypothetical protein
MRRYSPLPTWWLIWRPLPARIELDVTSSHVDGPCLLTGASNVCLKATALSWRFEIHERIRSNRPAGPTRAGKRGRQGDAEYITSGQLAGRRGIGPQNGCSGAWVPARATTRPRRLIYLRDVGPIVHEPAKSVFSGVLVDLVIASPFLFDFCGDHVS